MLKLNYSIVFASKKYIIFAIIVSSLRDDAFSIIEEQNRPFMTLNLDTPSPTAYDPPTNPPNMTTSPAYTMRPKTYPEKGNWLIFIESNLSLCVTLHS